MDQLELFKSNDGFYTISFDPQDRIDIGNRKFLGSKQRLIVFIEKSVLERVPNMGIFCDGFSGTGVVANRFKRHADHIIANDILYSSFIVNKAFLNSSKETVSLEKMKQLLYELNNITTSEGYVFHNYGGKYFTNDNAALIDSIREKIEFYVKEKICTEQEKYILLTSLLFAIDKVANTVGQYDAFLKHIGKESYDRYGRHVIDSNVYKRLHLRLPNIELNGMNEVYNEDLNNLISKIEGDVLYLDPPYNNRQYIDCYHVLENILLWKKPKLYGKTKKFSRDHLKSHYSKRDEAPKAFCELISKADFAHIFLSYNNEGIIPDELIVSALRKRGDLEILEKEYRIFGNGAGRSVKRPIKERLFYCKVNKTSART